LKYRIEIATTDFTTTEAAVKGGADRIELCSAISEGGLTPSFGHIKRCRQKFALPIFPIIRPRSGDFLYTEEEFELMLTDIKLCRELGCDGVVTGFLLPDGSLNRKRTQAAVAAAYPLEVTFHRAFDRCRDPFAALEQIIEAGCQRILTSGQQLKSTDDPERIRQLITAANNRVIIMPGSGIRPENIQQLAEQTGAVEFHGALRNSAVSKMDYRNPVFEAAGDYFNPWIDEEEVKALKAALLVLEAANANEPAYDQ
jgi:copper homeostasis protein